MLLVLYVWSLCFVFVPLCHIISYVYMFFLVAARRALAFQTATVGASSSAALSLLPIDRNARIISRQDAPSAGFVFRSSQMEFRVLSYTVLRHSPFNLGFCARQIQYESPNKKKSIMAPSLS